MQIALSPEQFNVYYVLYGNRSRNTIVENSNYINVNYSTELMTLNNICIYFSLHDFVIDEYYNKFKCEYENNDHNRSVALKLSYIEKKIIDKYLSQTASKPFYKLKHQFDTTNRIKVFNLKTDTKIKQSSGKFLLKISGLWENEDEYGLIYKFYSL